MKTKETIIIDLEFTGLNNSFICDNEITELKMRNLSTGKTFFQKFGTDKELSLHSRLHNGNVKRYEGEHFSSELFYKAVKSISSEDAEIDFYGFSIEKDKEMLSRYDIHITPPRKL